MKEKQRVSFDALIHPEVRQASSKAGVELLRKTRIALGFVVFSALLSLVAAIVATIFPNMDLFDERLGWISFAAFSACGVVMRFSRGYQIPVTITGLGVILTTIPIRMFDTGGTTGPNAIWFVVLPIAGAGFLPLLWCRVISFGCLVFLVIARLVEVPLGIIEPTAAIDIRYFMSTLAVLVTAHVFVEAYEASRRRKEEEVEEDRSSFFHSSRMASLGELAGGIAHEINNPLAIALGYAELLKTATADNMPRERQEEAAGRVMRALGRVKMTVDTVRKLSRDAELDHPLPVPVSGLLDAIKALSSRRTQRVEDFTVDVDENAYVLGRESEIVQVVLNLINNATDAVADIEHSKVAIRTWREDDRIHFEITDNGPGIPAELVEKVMEPFFTTKPLGQGTGLGLSLATLILARHRTRLEYARVDDLTKFSFALPEAEAPEATQPKPAANSKNAA